MSELQKYRSENGAEIIAFKKPEVKFYGKEIKLSELNKSELAFIETINYFQIQEIEENQLLEMVFVIVSNNLRAMQSKMVAKDQVLLVNDLIHELNIDFPTLTIKEVELIIKNGIRGKYETDTRGLSVVNFNFWTRSYLDQKYKMNLELEKKIGRNLIEQDPIPVTKESTLNILRSEWKIQLEKYNLLSDDKKEKISFDDYWLEHGNKISSKYLFSQLKKFGLITDLDLKNELNGSVSNSHISGVVERIEAERKIICKLALKLRNANSQK